MFNIPIVLLTYRRYDKIMKILDVIETLDPIRVYIVSDHGATEEAREDVVKLRKNVEKRLSEMNCEVLKNYADTNRGVYANIALGAKWVFAREKRAIFLEDDNLPDATFFPYCKEMLERYEKNDKVLAVCGTNYFEQTSPSDGSDYYFSARFLPCGWASWSNKFLKHYNDTFKGLDEKKTRSYVKSRYPNKLLFGYDMQLFRNEKDRVDNHTRPISWDYQMQFSILKDGMYVIIPKNNLIKNIGVDDVSTHSPSSGKREEIVYRFCRMELFPLKFPLKHPKKVEVDPVFEKDLFDFFLPPKKSLFRYFVALRIKKLLGKDINKPLLKRG